MSKFKRKLNYSEPANHMPDHQSVFLYTTYNSCTSTVKRMPAFAEVINIKGSSPEATRKAVLILLSVQEAINVTRFVIYLSFNVQDMWD